MRDHTTIDIPCSYEQETIQKPQQKHRNQDQWGAKMMFMYRQKKKRLKNINDEIPNGEIRSIKLSKV